MNVSQQARLFICWCALTGITLFGWWVSIYSENPFQPQAAVGLSALAITLIKVRVITREFMEVKHAPARLRYITDGWLVVFIIAMAVAYFAV